MKRKNVIIPAAVLAIAPVAGMPPKIGAKMLATPWANSSALERCLVPTILSATTAERSDSIDERTAIVMASGSKVCIL